MVVCEWHLRTYDEEVDEEHAYHSNLDFGLKALRIDQDVLNLINHTTKYKLIEIYCMHEYTDLEVVIEEKTPKKIEVDMKDFYEHTDKEVEWIGCNKGNNEIHVKHIVGESYDLNDFISASDSDTELEDKKKKSFEKMLKDVLILLNLLGHLEGFTYAYELSRGVLKHGCETSLGDDLDLTRDSKFTFMSDRHKGLIPLIAQVFPCVEHRVCLRHIHENMKLQFKGDLYKEFLWNYASATIKVQQGIDKSKGPLTLAAVVLFKAITDEASFYKLGINWTLLQHVVRALWDMAAENKMMWGIPESWGPMLSIGCC
ncbi:mutator type transposase [Tanacetum coccineum]